MLLITGTGRCGTALAAEVFGVGHEDCTSPDVPLEQWSVVSTSSWLLLPWLEKIGKPPEALIFGLKRRRSECVESLSATLFRRNNAWRRFAFANAKARGPGDFYDEWNERLEPFVDVWLQSEVLFKGRPKVNSRRVRPRRIK